MTHFNESKLSRIIARRIIAPEDRSQLLPLCTPIYCPTYNGVRASRVTVINPNTNSFNVSSTLPNTTSIGVTQTKGTSGLNSLVEKNGDIVVDEHGIATGFSTSNYISMETVTALGIQKIHVSEQLPAVLTTPINIASMTAGTVIEAIVVQPNGNIQLTRGGTVVSQLGTAKLGSDVHVDLVIRPGQVNVTIKHLRADNSDLKEVFINGTDAITLVTFGASSDANLRMDLAHAYFVLGNNRVPFFNSGRQVGTITNQKNTFDIDMTIPVSHTYFVPHEVDLETDINLLDQIKSDFAVRFKHAVSEEIAKQIIANKADITNLVMADTVADSVGLAIADNIINGTGQKYSIYKYDNGAPVSYIKSSNQPNIDDLVLDEEKPDALLSEIPPNAYRREFAVKDDVDVPALYYIEKPTLLFDNAKFIEYQQGLCNGSIRDYADKKINVDTANINFTEIGEGIFGSNDTFAVAFTEASIKFEKDKEYYADNVVVTVFFGVKLVHTNNLRLFT